MGKRFTFFFILVSLVFYLRLKADRPELPEKYKKWIKEEVVYIITPKEKEVFYKLGTDKERDLFIEEFWRQRDPTPGTPRNEFKEEHYRRIEYANKKLGRGTPFQGWRTDRGKIYIKLGEPVQIVRFDTGELYPIRIWYYHGNPKFGQAPIFRLLFFKKYGGGEFELYSPIADGPRSLTPLILGGSFDDQDRAAYGLIKERVSLELAETSLSSFPGQRGWHLRLPSAILIGEIKTYPYKKVKDDYAYEFLEHKEVVEVSYSVYYIGNQSKVSVIQDPSGLFFVNYSIEPETLSVDFYEDKYFANLKISMRVTNLKEKTIFQQGRNVPIELKKEQLKKIGQRPFHLCDSFPLIPGNYKFNLLLENTVTKEFTSFEKNITVPESEFLQMSSPILARNVNRDSPFSQLNKAFQIGNLQIYPSLRNNFFKKDKLFIFFQIYGLSQELRENGILEYTLFKGEQKFHTIRKKINEYKSAQDFLEEFSLEKFPPGRYRMKVYLLDGEGKEILFEGEEFSVSSKPLPESWMVSQTNLPVADPLYSFLLGNQFLNNGEIRKARDELEKAYNREPDSLDYALSYARVLLILKEYQKAKEILLPFVEAKKENFKLYYFIGKSSQEEGELEEAISYYQKALSHKGNVVEILNSLGECYIKLGENKKALKVLQKSLEINPKQERIKKIIELLREKNSELLLIRGKNLN